MEILTKIWAKITIIVVENREPYYFIFIICKCKEVPLSLFSYQMMASTPTRDKQSIYYKVYVISKSFLDHSLDKPLTGTIDTPTNCAKISNPISPSLLQRE